MKRTNRNSETRNLLNRLDIAEENVNTDGGSRPESGYVRRRNEGYCSETQINRPAAENDNYGTEGNSYRPDRGAENRQRQNTSLKVRNDNRTAVNRNVRRDVNNSAARRGRSHGVSHQGSRYSGSRYKQTGTGRKRRRKKKGSKAFTIGLVIFAAVLALGVTIAILTLSSFLKVYESSLPVNVVEQVINELSEGRYEGMNIVSYDETPVSDEIAFAEDGYFSDYFRKHLSAGEVTYRKLNGESTDTTFIYAVKVGDDDFLKISLNKQPEEADFGLSTWEMAGGQVLDDKLVMKTIRIQAPQEAKVYVNGISVDDTYAVSEGSLVNELKNLVSSGYLAEENAAYVKELNVNGLLADGDTKVTLTNADGTTEECILNDDVYSGGFKATEEFGAARIDRVTEMIYPWCYYFSGDGSFYTLSQYIWDYSPAYNTVQAADTSWMQEHSDISIDNIVVDNFRRYSDTCFSCDVRFQENIYQWGTLARTWDSYMTWIYINGSNTFYMADYITHNTSEK